MRSFFCAAQSQQVYTQVVSVGGPSKQVSQFACDRHLEETVQTMVAHSSRRALSASLHNQARFLEFRSANTPSPKKQQNLLRSSRHCISFRIQENPTIQCRELWRPLRHVPRYPLCARPGWLARSCDFAESAPWGLADLDAWRQTSAAMGAELQLVHNFSISPKHNFFATFP